MRGDDNYTFKRARVLSVKDDTDGLRVKVRLHPQDNQIANDDDLPFCFPLIPKMLHVNPKEGESVLVVLANQGDPLGDRYFIGPIIAQPQNLNNASSESGAFTLMQGSVMTPGVNPSNNPENLGSFPERDDIAVRGRDNTDLILKTDELRLRCGIHKGGANKLAFNDVNMGYLQMKYLNGVQHNGTPFNSVMSFVADKINLLSYQSIDNFKLNDREQLITEDELFKILDEAHKLPYGDLLIDFLRKFLRAFINHTHNFPGNPTLLTNEVTTIANYDLESILCESIRIS